jgi:hypothetical protein
MLHAKRLLDKIDGMYLMSDSTLNVFIKNLLQHDNMFVALTFAVHELLPNLKGREALRVEGVFFGCMNPAYRNMILKDIKTAAKSLRKELKVETKRLRSDNRRLKAESKRLAKELQQIEKRRRKILNV